MKNLLIRFRDEEDAATAVEYAIITGVVAVGLGGVIFAFSDAIVAMFNQAMAAFGP